jgi:MGT family glycosyltransferase
MTFGTVLGHMSIAADVYRTALHAVDGLEARVLLTVGRHFDRSGLGPIPRNVHVEAWVEQQRVLDETDVVVCHGGSGTVFGALASGVPVVVVPVFADQFDNGRRVAASRAGLVVETDQGSGKDPRTVINEHDVPRFRAAVEEVRGTSSYRQQARLIAAEMASAPTVDEVLDSLLNLR